LQRYITASGEVLVWGETGGALNALASWEQITADSSRHFSNSVGGKGERIYNRFITTPKSEQAKNWIANLTPPFSEIITSVQSMLIELYGKRAETLGYPRFGIKETHCDLATARCLQSLFPDAKFAFLVRDPFAVMLSIKRRAWMGHQASLATLHHYAEHWRTRSAQFREAGFGMTFRYEDFIADPALRNKLLDHLEINHRPPENFTETSQVDF
jgi:hypothetical protein